MTLVAKLQRLISSGGPLPFEQFMEASLYDADHGFFASGPLRSVQSGDFLTSPEVSPWFGRMLARFVDQERTRLDEPPGFVVVDVGAGSGSLLAALHSELAAPHPALWAAEASAAARERLGTIVPAGRVVPDLDGLPPVLDGVILANELLDNLPAALAVRVDGGWEERHVDVHGEGFGLVAVPARRAVADWADRYGGRVPVGGMVEVQLAATSWMQRALGRLRSGALVVIDYGGTAEELEPRRTRGTLRTYRNHHLGPDPLLEPGATDITVDVNFTALMAAASGAGAEVELVRQDDFLDRLGLGAEISRMRRVELELARGDDVMSRLMVRSERTDAETLLHPRGLGDFRVLTARR